MPALIFALAALLPLALGQSRLPFPNYYHGPPLHPPQAIPQPPPGILPPPVVIAPKPDNHDIKPVQFYTKAPAYGPYNYGGYKQDPYLGGPQRVTVKPVADVYRPIEQPKPPHVRLPPPQPHYGPPREDPRVAKLQKELLALTERVSKIEHEQAMFEEAQNGSPIIMAAAQLLLIAQW